MKIHPIIAHNPLENIFYVLEYGNKQTIVIDPHETQICQDFLNEHDLELKRILITHEHYDHYDGVEGLNCNEVYAGELASENISLKISHKFQDKEIVFEHEDISIKAIFTPGHSQGHMMFEMSEKGRVTTLFSGDVVFPGGVGHTRRGGNEKLYESMQKFEKYDDEVMIYSGHDYMKNNCNFLKEYTPENISEIDNMLRIKGDKVYFTNLGEERKYNPFLTVSKDEFIRLRNFRNTW